MEKPIAIIGGGISGLAAAYFISREGLPCLLIEAAPGLGGVIRTERVEGCVVEAGPDSFLAQKPWALELIRELGIEDQVIGSNDHLRRTYVCRKGRLVPLPDGIQFLAPTRLWPVVTTPLFSWKSKVRMGLEWFRRAGKEHSDRSVAEFVTDHFGTEVNEYLAQPMLAGVYGGAPENLSVKSVLPLFVELERRYGSLTRGLLLSRRKDGASGGAGGGDRPKLPLFQSLRGGMQQLTDTLASKIEGRVRVVTGAVRSLQGQCGDFCIATDHEVLAAGQVMLAMPAYRAGELVRASSAPLADVLTSIPYTSSVTAALLYDGRRFGHPLNGFGFLVPRAENNSLTACTWVNTKFHHRAASDRALLRGFLAAERAEGISQSSDEEIACLVHGQLRELMGLRQEPVAWRVSRWHRAMAQYEVGHQKRLAEIEERLSRLPGLHLTGNAYLGAGIPDCIRRSRQVAQEAIRIARTPEGR